MKRKLIVETEDDELEVGMMLQAETLYKDGELAGHGYWYVTILEVVEE